MGILHQATGRALLHPPRTTVRPERNRSHDVAGWDEEIVAVDNTQMPDALLEYLEMTSSRHSDIYGDYEICPLERDRLGHMRSVCVSSGSRLVVQDRERKRPPVRLLATWPKEVSR